MIELEGTTEGVWLCVIGRSRAMRRRLSVDHPVDRVRSMAFPKEAKLAKYLSLVPTCSKPKACPSGL